MAEFDGLTLFVAILGLIAGGLVKGAIGIGLPVVTVAFLASLLPVPLVLALVSIPILATNFWQAVVAGSPLVPLRRFWLMILCLWLFLWPSAQLVVDLDPRVLYGGIGIAVVSFTTTSYLRPSARLSPRAERILGPLAGAVGGILGGISTMWGPPMMIFFVLLGLEKEEFIRTVGFVWLLASVPLVAAYVVNGILTLETASLSALACGPAFLGLWLGQVLRRRIDQATFRKVLLIALFVVGLNLLRRAVMG